MGSQGLFLAVAKKDFYIVEKQGSQAEPKFNSRVTKNHSEHLSNQAQILENYTTLIR